MIINLQTKFKPGTPGTILLPVTNKAGKIQPEVLTELAALTGQPAHFIDQCFQGGTKEIFPLVTPEAIYILLGLGEQPDFRSTSKTFQQLAAKHSKLLSSALYLHFGLQPNLDSLPYLAEAAVNGLWQGTYQLGQHKSGEPTPHLLHDEATTLTVIAASDHHTALQKGTERAIVIAEAQRGIMHLIDSPANLKTPQHLARFAENSAQKYKYSTTVWTKAQIQAAGMGGLLGVNQGSPDPPVFIVMEYKGTSQNGRLPKVGLVGKGVTFDTGGLSLKPSNNMHYMKSDMGGAAAVLGTLEVAARLELPVHLIGIVPSTDNSVDAHALKPSDVITTYGGKTIEIIDTDAEGRLILADGLGYMVANYKPDILIDLATLTGSSVRTLGYLAAALFSNDDQLAHHLEQAGQHCGERVWRLPLWEEYGDDMKSDVADIKNLSARPVAGAITAAKFLEFFTDSHPSWAHLDIAGAAFGDTPHGQGKAATGYGVRLLTEFLEGLVK